jgi:hypothetical protein
VDCLNHDNWRASVGSSHTKNPQDGNNSRIPYSEGSFPPKHMFLKFKYKNIIKMKNKPDPGQIRSDPPNWSQEAKKKFFKS